MTQMLTVVSFSFSSFNAEIVISAIITETRMLEEINITCCLVSQNFSLWDSKTWSKLNHSYSSECALSPFSKIYPGLYVLRKVGPVFLVSS